jgi:hypothetical protein
LKGALRRAASTCAANATREFENLQGFLEHIALVMVVDKGESREAVSFLQRA